MEFKVYARNGYVWDKRIFMGFFLLVAAFAFFLLYQNDFDMSPQFYVECSSPFGCPNPLFGGQYQSSGFSEMKYISETDCDWCNLEILPMGTYGEKPSVLVDKFGLFVIIGFVIMLFLNHFVHNKGKEIGFIEPKDKLTQWVIKQFKKFKIEEDEE